MLLSTPLSILAILSSSLDEEYAVLSNTIYSFANVYSFGNFQPIGFFIVINTAALEKNWSWYAPQGIKSSFPGL